MRLSNRVVFVTGASRGIGRACALACAREGADVVIAARTDANAPAGGPEGTIHDVEAAVVALGRRALALKLDVRDDAACEAAVLAALDRFGRVDALVHNAGALYMADVVETPVKKFDLLMGVNLRAAFVLARAALPSMLKHRFGHLVMIAPPVDVSAVAHHGAYAVSKLGMTLLAHALVEETAGHNVTAHALWPATAIETHATRSYGLGGPEQWRTPEVVADALVALVAREPSARRGRAWIDEEVLREEGVTDFAKYQCVPGVEPPHFPFAASAATS
jgi:citronellol/citronellal dehydrogenase